MTGSHKWYVVRTRGGEAIEADDVRVGVGGSLEFYVGAMLVAAYPEQEWQKVVLRDN